MPDINKEQQSQGQCGSKQKGELNRDVEMGQERQDESCGTCGPSDVTSGDKESERES